MDRELFEWTINYVKNRDLTQKKLLRFDEHLNKGYIDFVFKDKPQRYFVQEDLSKALLKELAVQEHKSIVCLNTDDNFTFLIKHWKLLSEVRNLNIVFVNLKLHDKWIINPHTHSMIADPYNIEVGLRTMFDTANGNAAEIKVKKKKQSMFEESINEMENE